MKSLCTFLLLVTLIPLSAQNYHPLVETGKLWSTYHNLCDQGNPYSIYEKIGSDTTIGPHTWKKLLSTHDSLLFGWTLGGFIREDTSHCVYYALDNVFFETLLYDFGLDIGDTVLVYGMPDCAYILDSITPYSLLNGETRNRYVLRYFDIYGGADSCYTYWIEGIGSLHGLMTPIFCYFVGDNPSLICFWENDIQKYHNSNFEECYVVTGIRDAGYGISDILVFPNPVQESITIEFATEIPNSLKFEMFDLSGVFLLRQTLEHPTTKINLKASRVAPGLYLFRITGNEGVIKIGKLICN